MTIITANGSLSFLFFTEIKMLNTKKATMPIIKTNVASTAKKYLPDPNGTL